MERKFQVFISSTYTDLIGARQAVSTALLRSNCFPAGMELFPAADMEQFEFIKRVIDASDYYLVILAGRYGSIHKETGLSFTEMEYDYAVSQKKTIIRLIHEAPLSLPSEAVEVSDVGKAKLLHFREKMSAGRLMRTWIDVPSLQYEAVLALQSAVQMDTQPGWSRGGIKQKQLIELQKENETLKMRLSQFEESEIADGGDVFPRIKEAVRFFGGDDAEISFDDFLNEVARFLESNIVFEGPLKEFWQQQGWSVQASDAFVTAFELDGIIKNKTSREIVLEPRGKKALQLVKLRHLMKS